MSALHHSVCFVPFVQTLQNLYVGEAFVMPFWPFIAKSDACVKSMHAFEVRKASS